MKKLTLMIVILFVSCVAFSAATFADVTAMPVNEWHVGYEWHRVSSYEIDRNNAYQSSYSLKIQNNEYNDTCLEKTFTVKPNTRYRFSAMVKFEGFEPNSDDTYITGASIGEAFTYSHSDYATKNTWTRLEYIFDTNDRKEITLCLRNGMFSGCCKGTAWFSDVKLEENQSTLSNEWNVLFAVFKNVDAEVTIDGKTFQYKDSLDSVDVNYLTNVVNNLYTSFDSISGGLMKVKKIDVFECDTVLTALGGDSNGYSLDPYDKQVSKFLDKCCSGSVVYNQIIAVSPISDVALGWAGLGGGNYKEINFCQINYKSRSTYPGNFEAFPDAIFVHEMLHCMESDSRSINPEKTAILHDNSKYGFTDGNDEWRAWYTAYMRAELNGDMGLDPSVYQVYNNYDYRLVSDDMYYPNGDTVPLDKPVQAEDAVIKYLSIPMRIGDKLKLSAVLSSSTAKAKVEWSTSKPSVASISSSGTVTAKKKGTTIITAVCGNSEIKVRIKVS